MSNIKSFTFMRLLGSAGNISVRASSSYGSARCYAMVSSPNYSATCKAVLMDSKRGLPLPANVACARAINTSQTRLAYHVPLTLKSIEDRLMLVLCCYDGIDPEVIKMDSDFVKDLGIDSLSFVEIILAVEDEFTCEIPDGDADRLTTPRKIFEYLCDKMDVYE